jgi:hypothetical protein
MIVATVLSKQAPQQMHQATEETYRTRLALSGSNSGTRSFDFRLQSPGKICINLQDVSKTATSELLSTLASVVNHQKPITYR